MNEPVVALLGAEDKLARGNIARLPGELVRIVELESVARKVTELSREIDQARIALVRAEVFETYPELHSWLRSLKPLIDLWQIHDGIEAPDAPADGFSEVIRVDQFTSAGIDALKERIERRLRQKELLAQEKIVARSARMGLIAETIERAAQSNVSVLIVGPSGSGKELIARAIHNQSFRSGAPFIALNCGAIPEGLIESELFGHERGAFTGSVSKREGYFSRADGGTIFLDEIGEMRSDMQVKLLRALEEGVFYPLGSDRPRQVNVRSIAATNRDLEDALASGEFRDDLYFRLAGVRIVAPPLAERREDIVPLVAEFSREAGISGYSPEAIELLEDYHWPGNVRQLRNFVTRMGAMVGHGEVVDSDVRRYIEEQGFVTPTLPALSAPRSQEIGQELLYQALLQLGGEVKALRELIVSNLKSASGSARGATVTVGEAGRVTESMQQMEARLMAETLRATGGNRRRAANRLGIGERTLYRKLKQFGLS